LIVANGCIYAYRRLRWLCVEPLAAVGVDALFAEFCLFI